MNYFPYVLISYLILAPTIMTQEKDEKTAASKCFESIGLDPDMYRCGHTKASILYFSLFASVHTFFKIPRMKSEYLFSEKFSPYSCTWILRAAWFDLKAWIPINSGYVSKSILNAPPHAQILSTQIVIITFSIYAMIWKFPFHQEFFFGPLNDPFYHLLLLVTWSLPQLPCKQLKTPKNVPAPV